MLPDFYELLVEYDYNFTADQNYQSQYPLEEITSTQAVDYGPVAALHSIAEKLELPSVLESHLQPKGGGPPLGDLLLIQIIARCLEPRSIDATTDWFPLTALPGLLDLSPERVTSETFYNSLDYVDEEGIERVHEELWTRVHELYDTPTDPLFYDLILPAVTLWKNSPPRDGEYLHVLTAGSITSSYFEGTACPLTDYGHSSEHRPDKQQLVMGVTVNPDMIPRHHDMYPGNTSHSKTVDDAAERIEEHGMPCFAC